MIIFNKLSVYMINEAVIYGVLLLLGLSMFLFVFWRGLKDDYIPSQIFSIAFTVFFIVVLTYVLSLYFFKQYRFWLIVLSLFIGFLVGTKRSGVRYYEAWDSYILSVFSSFFIPILILYKNWSIDWVLFYISIAVSFIIFFIIKNVYKSFIWYKSGKRGFPGLFSIGVFFLIRSVISFVKPDYTLSLIEYDLFFSGLISFMSFLNIFILANK